MLKLKVDQAGYDALNEAQKACYVKDKEGDGYSLDLDPADIPDVEGLKRNNRDLLEEKRVAQQKAAEAERERAKKEGDMVALESSWQTRLDTEVGNVAKERDAARAQLERLTVGRTATELAAELAVVTNGVSSSKALLPHIERRLSLEIGADGETKVRVLDATGKPSAMTLDQLKDEFRKEPAFAPLIKASQANGSGGDGNNGGGGAVEDKPFADMNSTERAALYKKNPTKFRELSEAHKAAQPRQR